MYRLQATKFGEIVRYYALWVVALCALLQGFPVHADEVTVRVRGIEDELKDNAKAFLTIRRKTRLPDQNLLQRLGQEDVAHTSFSPDNIALWHSLAESEIQQALQPFGFYNVVVAADLTQLAPDSWQATYRVNAGEKSRWRKIGLVAEDLPRELDDLRTRAVPRVDDKVDHQQYETYKRQWIARLFDAGFLDAKFSTATFTVDAENNAVDLDWQIVAGPQYLFGPIDVKQSILKDSLVSRYHSIEEGTPFNTNALVDLQLNLNNSNYFESVSLDIRKDQAVDYRVPVVVLTQPRKRKRYNAGLGYGTDTGPRVTAGIESRRVNKRGHRYRLNARASTVASSLQFEYDIPIKDVAKDRWRLYAEVQKSDVGDADATQYSIGAAREDDWGLFRRRLFLNAERSLFSFGDERSQAATIIYPGVTLSFDRLDDPQFVRRGFSVAATLLGGADSLGSSTSFGSLAFTGRAILPLGRRGRLLGAVNVGVVEAEEFLALPPSQRLFLGGDRSVRGYGFQTISPENAAGDDIGGSRSLALSLEADYQIAGAWGIAAFVDSGDVSDASPTDFRTGVGVGVRYRSPVGMIRLDLAHPLDDPDTNVRVHLSIGSDL